MAQRRSRLVMPRSFGFSYAGDLAGVGSQSKPEALELRIRVLRDFERSLAQKRGTPPTFLASVHDLVAEAEAELDRINGEPPRSGET